MGSSLGDTNILRYRAGTWNLFTKILSKQEFEKHRKVVLNLPGDTGVEHARREAVAGRSAPSQRDGTGAT